MVKPTRRAPLVASALVVALAAPLLAFVGTIGGDALPEPLRTRLDTIVVDDLKRHLTLLTSVDCAGRDTPQAGLTKARDYLVAQHKGFGLESANPDGSFLFDFEVPSITWSDDDNLAVVKGTGISDVEVYLPGTDFVPVRGSGSGTVEGEVVFCGYGISDAEEKYDDYRGADVKDRIVALLLHEPREARKGRPFKGEEWTPAGAITSKWKLAEEKGAKAVLLFTDPANHQDLSVLKGEHPRYGSLREGGGGPKIPVLHCSGAIGDRLFGAGRLLEWQKSLDQRLAGAPKKVADRRVRLTVSMRNAPAKVQDVVAAKKGVDPALQDQWIVIGAHYDHVGVDEYGRIFHGADDNGSGTSCLLEIAEAISAREVTFKRSILLIHFAGEEKGLLGAAAFCKNPLMPPDKMFAMVNMDMVGRGRPHDIDAAGLANSNDFQALVRKAVALGKAKLKVGEGGMQFFQRSDQLEFWKLGVPVLFFMEPEEHADYHKVTDTMDKIVYGKVAETARVVTALAWLLSEAESRPKQEGIKGQ
jgi:hypothetical protein